MSELEENEHKDSHIESLRSQHVTRADIGDLSEAVIALRITVQDLNRKMDRQWRVLRNKRWRMVGWLVGLGILFTIAAAQITDAHTRDCMTFGSVPDEASRITCNLLYPFHDHPVGGMSDEDLERAIQRAIELRQRMRDSRGF